MKSINQDKLPHIGTAGWAIPSLMSDFFPPGKSALERYSQVFNAVEINSSFYRSHRRTTYERWAITTPVGFLFSVKIPKKITHDQRLESVDAYVEQFVDEVSGLQTKLGPLLVQLPPSLKFEPEIAESFFKLMRNKFIGDIVLEPRHNSWCKPEAIAILNQYKIVLVIADPNIISFEMDCEQAFQYHRLHGKPKIYSSPYESVFLNQLASNINTTSWVIFDNTQFGASTNNALFLKNAFMQNSRI